MYVCMYVYMYIHTHIRMHISSWSKRLCGLCRCKGLLHAKTIIISTIIIIIIIITIIISIVSGHDLRAHADLDEEVLG